MTNETKSAVLEMMFRNGVSIGQLIIENNGEVIYNKEMPKSEESAMRVTAEQMVAAVEDSFNAGLWWASTGWAAVYRIYCNYGYNGSMSAFEREVESWRFSKKPYYECKANGFCKPLQRNPLVGSSVNWRCDGVDTRMVTLGCFIEKKLENIIHQK